MMKKTKMDERLVVDTAEAERVIAAARASIAASMELELGDEVWKRAPDVEQWLADARACQAVYQSGNAVSVAELQALVTRAVGLLG